MKIIYSNKEKFLKTLENIKKDGAENLHILADFDRTLTKAFFNGEKKLALISVLQKKGYLGEEYSKKYKEFFEYYYPFEIDTKLIKEEKSEKMQEWWEKVNNLLIEHKLNLKNVDECVNDGMTKFRDGVEYFFSNLENKNIPTVIISANGLGYEAIELFFKRNNINIENISIISNKFIWNEKGFATGYEKPVIHTFNKDETVLKNFLEIHSKIEKRKNVILLGDSLGDPHMVDGFEYKNLLKIGFLNEKEDELLESYKEKYDLIITGDGDFSVINEIMEGIK